MAEKVSKKTLKRKRGKVSKDVLPITPAIIPERLRNSDDIIPSKVKWTNKTRVLIFSSRGISYRDRHLMEDLRKLMPHSKPETKNSKNHLDSINEMAEMKNCSKVLYFEPKKRKDLYLWMANVCRGPSVKFLIQNIHTMNELKLTGNCLKGSRPLLTFDSNFKEPHWLLIKELLTQIFGIPKGHPKSQPFVDKIYNFSILDNKIWFRNYQIVEEDGQLTEIGPRFVLNPIKIFDGSFGGASLWSNPFYITPNNIRSLQKKEKSSKYIDTVTQKEGKVKRRENQSFIGDPTHDIFETQIPSKPQKKKRKIDSHEQSVESDD